MIEKAKSSASIEIRGLYKIFGADDARYVEAVKSGLSKAQLIAEHGRILGLNDINISMPAGKIQVIMGLSGSGKSTLIRHINRLIEPTAGSVVVDGQDILKMGEIELRQFRRSSTAMVFQKFALLPHRTVLENTIFGLEVRGIPKTKARDVGMRWIERVGLHGYANHYPSQLSGGMQQRVGLARALSNDAPVLLMDEAYSALDPLIRTDMQSVLLDLQTELNKTIVFITHDLDEALRLGDQITILREGSVIQQGNSHDIILHPADEYIADFVKDVNRGRFVKVDAVMGPLTSSGRGTIPEIRSGVTLEVAAKELAGSDAVDALVVGKDRQPLGTVHLRDIALAMATSSNERSASNASQSTWR
ncbi:betaine/proline/choline family ABC transporter ATP-binding protein [Mesorhizobium sp.]|uniref:quaternary amine ABC transporter ATP-binding protein n=1 Tax=Mesorhizobium sp. TaxID=1871066 RepID=UPI000FE61230|nr:betaine/proline/choline family ABC transporter ATP-binding protein [Mesorhizobium sp.]RWB69923.1 MAG: ATP-binding cassette domain-containing protein [Mesorhizobium sp.]